MQGSANLNIMLKAKEYEEMCAPLVARLEGPIKKALEEAKLTPKDLASVEIVGGCTRIGFVKSKLEKILGGATLSTTMNADEAVARGAALQSAILSPRFKVLPYRSDERFTVACKPSFWINVNSLLFEVATNFFTNRIEVIGHFCQEDPSFV